MSGCQPEHTTAKHYQGKLTHYFTNNTSSALRSSIYGSTPATQLPHSHPTPDDDDCGFKVRRLGKSYGAYLSLPLLQSNPTPAPFSSCYSPFATSPLSLLPPHPSASSPVNPTQVVIPIEELDLLERLGAGPAGRHRRMEAEEAEQSRAARLLRSQDQQLREAFTD